MSYSRSYSETVSKTEHYSYPASEHGGSGSITVTIPVDVNIHVDTIPFDTSVQHCDNNINILTGAVVATEAAEVESKNENSKKVANTIIGGFFSLIRLEISSQIAELYQNVEAQMMHLKELVQSCISKKKQMEGDYIRISSRYVKIFEDLNNELSNRVHELDNPTFVFKKETDKQKIRTTDNDLVNTISIFGAESGDLQSKISSSIAKKRAFDTLLTAKNFLLRQKKLNVTIQQSMLNENKSCSILVPICFVETNNNDIKIDKTVYSTSYLSVLQNESQKNELIERFSSTSLSWNKLTQDDQKNISLYLNTELDNKSSGNDPHSVRVRETIQKIANVSLINAIKI